MVATKKQRPTVAKKVVPAKKNVAAKPSPWTEVEDFFLEGKLGALSRAEVAEKLRRSEDEVARRIAELGLVGRIAQATREQRLKGFQTHPSGSVSMTESRAAEPPTQPKTNWLTLPDKYKNSAHQIF